MSYTIHKARDAQDVFLSILTPLLDFNEARVGDAVGTAFALTVIDAEGEICGGLFARNNWGAFYVALLIVPEAARGQGLGRELMARAEAQAREEGCRMMWLDTFEFQARGFYEKLGFTLFGQIDGPPPAFPRYFLQKPL
jgi:GNAT superfamily N-acetyltransferase